MSDVALRASRLRARPAARRLGPAAGTDDWITRWAVRQLVGEAVLDHAIRSAADPAATDRPEAAIRHLVRRVTEHVKVSERDVRAHYERNLDRYRVPERRRVRYVALASRADAARALARLKAHDIEATGGVRWAEMELQRGDYVGRFEAAVFAASVGDVVGPLRTEHGWLAARVEEIAASATVPYEVVRRAIARELLEIARARAFDDWLERQRLELGRISPDYEHPAHPLHGQPRHRH